MSPVHVSLFIYFAFLFAHSDNCLHQHSRRCTVYVFRRLIFIPFDKPYLCHKDAWDGYRQNRLRILNHLQTNNIDNTLILSGDSHANWVSDLVQPNNPRSALVHFYVTHARARAHTQTNIHRFM